MGRWADKGDPMAPADKFFEIFQAGQVGMATAD